MEWVFIGTAISCPVVQYWGLRGDFWLCGAWGLNQQRENSVVCSSINVFLQIADATIYQSDLDSLCSWETNQSDATLQYMRYLINCLLKLFFYFILQRHAQHSMLTNVVLYTVCMFWHETEAQQSNPFRPSKITRNESDVDRIISRYLLLPKP